MSPVITDPSRYELVGDQRRWPFVWVAVADISDLLPELDTSNGVLERAFGPGRSRKLKSWGHTGPVGCHYLATRAGTRLHTDPAYSRYSHHMIVRNDGFRTRGLAEAPDSFPILKPGVFYCLDAHSPHEVLIDRRLSGLRVAPALYKLDVTFDTDKPMSEGQAEAIFREHLANVPVEAGIDLARKTAPAPRSGARP